MKIMYQGHGSLRIISNQGAVIYVDPYAGEGYDLPADGILVTHQHFDHNCIKKPAKKENCVIWQNDDALVKGQYCSTTIADVSVQAVEAYNGNHKKGQCVGFVLKCGNTVVYIAGDTSTTEQMPHMANLSIDYAFLPCDGKYNMGITEAMQCAKLINAKHVIPYHMAPSKLYDEIIAKQFNLPNTVYVKPNETIEV